MDKPMKYCAKHNQHYMHFLHTCPICIGEALADLPKVPLGPLRIDEEKIPNKTGLYLKRPVDNESASSPPVRPPLQMSLFE